MNVKWAADVGKEIKSVYAAGKSIAFLPSDPSDSDHLSGAGQMTETAPQAGSPPLATLLVAALKRLATSALPFVVVHPDLAVRLAVLSALPVSVTGRRVQALP